MKAPVALISSVDPSLGSSITAPVRPCSFESHFLICLNGLISILGFAAALSYIIVDALNTSLLFKIVTLLANLVKNVASSIAESPPPITNTSSSLKNAPSQVAQVEIPLPFCASSFSAFSQIASAPVQTIIA